MNINVGEEIIDEMIDYILFEFEKVQIEKYLSNRLILVENFECSICLENGNSRDYVKLDCNHIFHFFCIYKWVKNKTTFSCPLCRITFEV